MTTTGAAAVAAAARRAGRAELAAALTASRADTLATFDAYVQALGAPAVAVPYRATLNPPLWELGHIGWFQEFWLARNPERARGHLADPDAPRPDSIRTGGDAFYNSSRVAHASRWQLPLPGIEATRADLAAQLDTTLALLATEPDDGDATLYFYRLALFHEDMHHEASVYMAAALGIDLPGTRWQPRPVASLDPATAAAPQAGFGHGPWSQGWRERGFAFDNECAGTDTVLADCRIDLRPVTWREWAAFAERGYDDPRLWTPEGLRWLGTLPTPGPAALRRDAGGAWQRCAGTRWAPLDGTVGDEAACHLSFHEAQAYCRFAGRRLPTEAEWERAAMSPGVGFIWGQVWEWTASPFAPFAGFEPHPYRDYSQPWFDGRPVLKGGSWATQPRMKHPRYRNYFTPERRDIVAGLRTCAA